MWRRLVVVVGLGACWSREPVASSPQTARHDRPVGTAKPQAAKAGCVEEKLCGHANRGCGPTGDSLAAYERWKLIATHASGPFPSGLATFRLDDAATAAYQERLRRERPDWTDVMVDNHCCYSQCSWPRVAKVPPVVAPDQYMELECIRAPAQQPTPAHVDNADCSPAHQLMPYVRGTQVQCCYAKIQKRLGRGFPEHGPPPTPARPGP